MKEVAIFDVDDCLGVLFTLLHPELEKVAGKAIPREKWANQDIERDYGITTQMLLDVIVERELLQKMEPLPNAVRIVNAIHDLGYRTVALTARAYHPQGQNITEDWMSRKGFMMDEVVILPVGQSKADMVRKIVGERGFAAMFIDDAGKHVRGVAQAHLAEQAFLLRGHIRDEGAGNYPLVVDTLQEMYIQFLARHMVKKMSHNQLENHLWELMRETRQVG